MERAFTLVIGGRRDAAPTLDPPRPVSPAERDARALVETWLDAPHGSVAESLDDLVRRVACALAARDPASAGH